MTIRPATDADVPAIVSLLKKSLGESLMQKSEEFWLWKHQRNPFGKSPVILACDDKKLIGVRAFMRWEWRDQSRVYKAVRAVDTATDPDYQGKGIFKKLTLELVEQSRIEGVDFIYNTPNSSSMPGYLKMGWETRGKLPVQIKVHLWRRSGPPAAEKNIWNSLLAHPVFLQQHAVGMKTNYSPAYFKWRYEENPNISYQLLSSAGDRPFILVYRERKTKRITEVRITDLLAGNEESCRFAISELAKVISAPSIVTLGISPAHLPGFIKVGLGPIVTVRNLNIKSWLNTVQFTNWKPALGDLELF